MEVLKMEGLQWIARISIMVTGFIILTGLMLDLVLLLNV
jgi:hypothetical protein